MPVDGGAGDPEFGGDLRHGVRAFALVVDLVVHLLGQGDLAGAEFGFLAAGAARAREPRRVQITENSAMEPRIWKRAVEVLMPWSSTTRSTPRDCSCRDSSRRCSKERPSRSASRVWPAAALKVDDASHITLRLPVLGTVRLPEPQRLTLLRRDRGAWRPGRAGMAYCPRPRWWSCVGRRSAQSRRATVRRSTRRRLSGGVMPQPAPGTIRGLAGVLSLSRRGQSPALVTPNIRTRRSMS